jgi:4-amino-4-deoxy-L-arabinose transferase-like glycosyltransferase
MNRKYVPLLVFLAATIWFSIGGTQRGLWTTGEHRYAEAARELVAEGHDHIVPHLNGEIYAHKPPIVFWMAGAPNRFLGVDMPFSARLPSILSGALTVMLTFLLGRRWYGDAAGFIAGGVVATTQLVDWASRMALIDGPLTACVTATIYCYVRADATPKERAEARAGWTALGFLAVAAGILVKGPPAPLIPGATLLVLLLWTAPREILTPKFAWGALLAVLPGALWLAVAYSRVGGGYVNDLLLGQAIGHAAGDVDKLEPWYFYLWNFPSGLMPWTVLVPAAVAAVIVRPRDGERRVDRLLLSWLFVSWFVFSISKAKRGLYLTPLHPAAALLIARLVRDATDEPARLAEPLARWATRLFAGAALAAGVLIVVAAVLVGTGADVAIVHAALPANSERLAKWAAKYVSLRNEFAAGRIVAAAVLGCVITWGGRTAWRGPTALRVATGLVVAAACSSLLDAVVLWPSRDSDESPRAFLDKVRATVGDAPVLRYGGAGGLQYAANWTLLRDSVPETNNPHRASKFLAEASPAPRYVVTDDDETEEFGPLTGGTEILRVPHRHNPAQVLFGNAAAAAASR